MSAVYDAAVLVAADCNDRSVWADHRVRLELGLVPITTAPVIAQVSRSARQAQLRRFLRGCHVDPFDASLAHDVGRLLARTGGSDVVDAHVALIAETSSAAVILTADVNDLRKLSNALSRPVPVVRV